MPTQDAAPPVTPTAAALAPEDAVAVVRSYAAYVRTSDTDGSGISLGQGRVLTAHHVVEDADRVWVRFPSGRQSEVKILGVDPRRDLALLQSSFMSEAAAEIDDGASLRQGAGLIAVGYPIFPSIGSLEPTVTRGTFSARRQLDGVWHVQTDMALNPGNSGGPVADSLGRVVGVVSFRVRNTIGLNLAVAGDEVKAFLNAPMRLPLPRTPATPAAATAPSKPGVPESKPAARPAAATPAPPPPPTPTPSASLPVAGLQIRFPGDGTRVPERLLIQGVQSRRLPDGFHVWLIVRAAVEGGAWYPGPGAIVARPDGMWSQEIVLGGPPNQRHEIRVGLVDAQAHSGLQRHLNEQRGQPLTTWRIPETWGETRVTVVRQ